MDFKFGIHALMDNPNMAPKKIGKMGVARVLNANSSTIVKDTNFKFGIHAPRESPDMTPENFF